MKIAARYESANKRAGQKSSETTSGNKKDKKEVGH